jgi:acyl carrier protein
MNSPIFERIRTIAADVLQVDASALTAESSPETVTAWDSVQHLNLLLAIEEAFGFQFAPEDMDRLENIGQIAGFVAARHTSPRTAA